MKVSTNPYKGARDFYPEDKRLQSWMFSVWKKVCEKYGYQEYDAPILEPTDLFLMKGNEEIIEEQTYTFKDRGDRSVTIRTEMTPSVSRMIAGKRQELAYPARWYSIPNLWRYERMQRGRLREFWQLNADIFGVEGVEAEIEMIQIIDDIFQEFKAKRSTYTIKVNSRLLVDTILSDTFELNKEDSAKVIRLTDRKAKMSAKEFKDSLADTVGSSKADKIIDLLESKSISELPESIKESESVKDIKQVLEVCKSYGIRNTEFDITLMRGFDYYTDIVFEVFDTGGENNRAMLGGGRYDGLVGQFGVDSVPTVGFGFGDVVLQDYLETYGLIPELKSTVDVNVLVKDSTLTGAAQLLAQDLRNSGINVAVDYSGKKFDKQFKSAIKSGVDYAVFVDADSAVSEKYTLRNMKKGVESKMTLKRLITTIATGK